MTMNLASDFYYFQDELSDRENESVASIRSYFETNVTPIATDYWARAEFPHHLIPGIASLGLFGPEWEESRQFESGAVYRGWTGLEMARVDASLNTFTGVQSGLAMGSIGVGGSDEQRAEWLPPMATGEVIGAFGLTEPLSGSDTAKGLRTTAERRGDSWVLNGEKRWIGNATFSDIVIIWARDAADGQVKGFIVPTSTPGFSATKIENKQSLRIVQNADIVMTEMIVPEENRLQKIDSFRDLAVILKLTRAGVAWQAVGNSIGAYEAAVAYAGERVQFGKPIAAHQLVQDRLAGCLANITASIALCVRVSKLHDEGRQADQHSALAKAFVTAKARETVAWSREVLGGNGIVLEYGTAKPFADAEAIYSFEGTREMNTLIVGRAITGHAAFV
ncbi:acyl-CoA dehydrogenase family protein [Subtercola boreus]|uniref:Acyl-CoA dehydrogenase n=1 Tax=Subtercola boreus TaxID=120213 RepID=A0A3E0WAP3_9MICO|nr:acyl-CoA dehydrogenase family protein [Subtercola boreus]RFA21146.1 acyl-CoA dehydrogenase [Subtercola boreus]RFA21529.1 acyl-CoA dehydrogenase [Subtercola boreus]RFA27499.1 acyl-CoA dehydrogenase [Subtercola boreus]